MDFNKILAAIPYLEPHRLRVTEQTQERIRVVMPFGKQLTNHVGTLHASALFTIAETAAGMHATDLIPGNRAIPLLRGAAIQYTRRASGDLTATASVKDGTASGVLAAFDADGRADVDIEVDVTDTENQTVFKGTFDYAMRPGKL